MENIWIEVLFDGVPVDNVTANSIKDAEEIIKSIEENGFKEYNEEVKNYWLELGFNNNPKATAKISEL